MENKFFLINFKALASVLMVVLNVCGIYTGFYDQLSKIKLNFSSKREIGNLNTSIIAFLKEHGIELQLSIRENEVTGFFDIDYPREPVDSDMEMKFRIPENVFISLLRKLFFDIFNLARENSITITPADSNSVWVEISADAEEQITLFTEDFTQLAMSVQNLTLLRSDDDKFKFLVIF